MSDPFLPPPLSAYFSRTDTTAALELFAPNAEVRDENEVHRGPGEIAAWLGSVEERYHPRYRVLTAEEHDGRTIVGFEVSGTFPGSPAKLRQSFVIADGRIHKLETL